MNEKEQAESNTDEIETAGSFPLQRWVIYLAHIREMREHSLPVEMALDYTIEFCEKNDLIEEFLSCKMNAAAFYALARYKAGEIGIDGLKKCVEVVNG